MQATVHQTCSHLGTCKDTRLSYRTWWKGHRNEICASLLFDTCSIRYWINRLPVSLMYLNALIFCFAWLKIPWSTLLISFPVWSILFYAVIFLHAKVRQCLLDHCAKIAYVFIDAIEHSMRPTGCLQPRIHQWTQVEMVDLTDRKPP
jgi:uncharacterized membrane-anchored protein YitT (DUF2179 family)